MILYMAAPEFIIRNPFDSRQLFPAELCRIYRSVEIELPEIVVGVHGHEDDGSVCLFDLYRVTGRGD